MLKRFPEIFFNQKHTLNIHISCALALVIKTVCNVKRGVANSCELTKWNSLLRHPAMSHLQTRKSCSSTGKPSRATHMECCAEVANVLVVVVWSGSSFSISKCVPFLALFFYTFFFCEEEAEWARNDDCKMCWVAEWEWEMSKAQNSYEKIHYFQNRSPAAGELTYLHSRESYGL